MTDITDEQIADLLNGMTSEKSKAQEEVDALLRGLDDGQLDDEDEGKSWGQVMEEHIEASHKKWRDSIADIVKDLKPCPYCGSIDVDVAWIFPPRVSCKNCEMTGPSFDAEKDAADAWNELPRR